MTGRPRGPRLPGLLALLAAVATSMLLVVPAGGAAIAQQGAGQPTERAAHRLALTRAKAGVQPGVAAQRITARLPRSAHGRVRFVLRGEGVGKVRQVRIRHGRAVYRVPALGSGDYRVRATYHGLRGSIGFTVYGADIALDQTSFTISASSYASQYAAQLRGTVRYRDKPAREGYVDVYLDGDDAGGHSSPSYLGFAGVSTNAELVYSYFGVDIARRYPPGTYTFEAFYTPTSSFRDYTSAVTVTVTVTA